MDVYLYTINITLKRDLRVEKFESFVLGLRSEI